MKSRKNKKSRILKPGNFFLAYFAFITVILLWNVFHCTEYSFPAVDLFPEEDTALLMQSDSAGLELKDGVSLLMRAGSEADDTDSVAKMIGKKPRLRGVALLGYENTHALKYSEELVSVQVIKTETGEVVGSGWLPLKNQTPYPNDETAVYIALSETVTEAEPKELEIRFSTSGLTRNGILITGGTAAEGENLPYARLYYEKKAWNPLMPILYYVLEILAGLGCLLLYGERKMPLLRSGRSEQQINPDDPPSSGGGIRKPAPGKISRQQIRQLTVPALVLFFVLAMMLFTYVRVIRKTAEACDGNLLTGGSQTENVIGLGPGMVLRQNVIIGDDDLSGIGIRLVGEDGKAIQSAKTASYAEDVLEWKILDETGTAVLTSGSAQVKELKKVKSMLSRDIEDETILAAAEESYVLPLEAPVHEADGKKFVLEIALSGKSEAEENVYFLAAGDTNGQVEIMPAEESLPLEICLMGVYKCNGFLRGMFRRVCIVVLIMLAVLYYIGHRCLRLPLQSEKQAAVMYLVSALCMGMVFSFVTPVYTISDERTHIDSVYNLSNTLLGINDIPGPKRLKKRACDIDSSIANTMPVTAQRYRAVSENLFKAAPKTSSLYQSADEETADGGRSVGAESAGLVSGRELFPAYARSALGNVPVLCYLPSAIGFSAARLLGRNMITMIMMARWFNLFACILVMYLAILRMPYGGAAMAIIGLFPKTLQQMSSCSYDGMVIAGCFLLIALSLNAAFDKNICIADLLVLILMSLFVAGCKGGTYLPLLGMVFVIPAVRSGQGKKMRVLWRAAAGACVGGAVLLFAGKYVVRLLTMFGRDSGTVAIAAGTKTLYTLSDFIHSPMKLVLVYINTIIVRGDGILGELVGKNLSQKWYIVYAFLILAFLGVLRRYRSESGNSVPKNHFRFPGRVWFLFIAAASKALIFMSMLLAFTAKDALYIDGLQGRYFLPIAILPFLAAENDLIHREGISDAALVYSADVLLAITICEIFFTYLGGA